PDNERPVIAAGCQPIALWRKRQAKHGAALQTATEFLAGRRIPYSDPTLPVSLAVRRRENLVTGCERHGPDIAHVARQDPAQSSRKDKGLPGRSESYFPDLRRSIACARRQTVAVARVGQAANLPFFDVERCPAAALLPAPELDHAVGASRSEHLTVRLKDNRIDPARMAAESGMFPARGRVPWLYCS